MAITPDRHIELAIEDGAAAGLVAVHDSGSGPGLLLLSDSGTAPECLLERTTLFADEGYAVLAFAAGLTGADVARAAELLTAMPETTSGAVCVAHGMVGAAALQASASFQALVVFDAPDLEDAGGMIAGAACPIVFQFGTLDTPEADLLAAEIGKHIPAHSATRVYAWPDAAPGFAMPGHPAFGARIDSLAHSRTLEAIRRAVGPYYDYVALFAEHIRHEFETRDVDATMATMIADPYVNHVATLAGGVGHDMLKRFYKYHFVEQNSRDRDSVTVSHTVGPDRVVLELVVRFRHDQVLDRYFPGIPATGQEVELATVLIVKFRGDKVCHEHIYWDQGSALKQIGVLDADHLPVAGADAARKVLDEHRPSNIFMQDAWATSEGKPL